MYGFELHLFMIKRTPVTLIKREICEVSYFDY